MEETRSTDLLAHGTQEAKEQVLAVQWKRPEAHACWHMVHRKLKSRVSCPMEEARGSRPVGKWYT